MKNMVLLAVVCAALSQGRAQESSPVQQQDSLKTYQLPEIVVTATRTEKSADAIGRSLTVISNQQLRTGLYQSVGEAISRVAGLYLVGAGQNWGMTQSIFLRGAASNQTAIMVDDIRLTDPSAVNNALDLSELSPLGFDRIEILRGSHSTLYGSSAIGGVVNLVTSKQRTPGLRLDAELRTGLFGQGASLFNQQLGLGYTLPVGLYFNGELYNSRVWGMDATIDTSRTTLMPRDRDGMHALDWLGKVGFRNDHLDIFLTFKNHQEKKDLDKAAYRDDDNYRLDFRRTLFTYGASYRFAEGWNLKFLGGISSMRRYAVDDSSVVDPSGRTDQTYTDAEYRGTTATHEVHASFRTVAFEAIVGTGLYRETMSSQSYFFTRSMYGPFEFRTNLDTLGLRTTTKHLFAHADLNGYLLDRSFQQFTLALGVRYSNHDSFGSFVTYEINPSYRLAEGSAVFVSYSTGFNAPSLYQLFAPDRNFSSGITRGNSALQPEESRSFEIGFKHAFGREAEVALSYFATAVERAIEYVYLWERTVPVEQLGKDFLRNDFRGDTYLNIGRQTTAGFELSFQARLSSQLSLSGNASLLRGTLRYQPADLSQEQTKGHHVQVYSNGAFLTREVESTELVRRPRTLLHARIEYSPSQDGQLWFELRHAGERSDIYYDSQRGPYGALGTLPVEAYTVADLTGLYRVSREFSVHLRLENLFDTRYREINGFATRGRGVVVSLQYAGRVD
jgi:vitamin B12 transporter